MSTEAQRDAAEAFAKAHVAECVYEMLEWQRTTILRDGKIRELALLCSFASPSQLRVAQSFVEKAAYEFIDQLGYYSE